MGPFAGSFVFNGLTSVPIRTATTKPSCLKERGRRVSKDSPERTGGAAFWNESFHTLALASRLET